MSGERDIAGCVSNLGAWLPLGNRISRRLYLNAGLHHLERMEVLLALCTLAARQCR